MNKTNKNIYIGSRPKDNSGTEDNRYRKKIDNILTKRYIDHNNNEIIMTLPECIQRHIVSFLTKEQALTFRQVSVGARYIVGTMHNLKLTFMEENDLGEKIECNISERIDWLKSEDEWIRNNTNTTRRRITVQIFDEDELSSFEKFLKNENHKNFIKRIETLDLTDFYSDEDDDYIIKPTTLTRIEKIINTYPIKKLTINNHYHPIAI